MAWALKIAPPLCGSFVRLWNDVYLKGVKGQEFTWDKSWDLVFQARVELLEVTCNIYMLGKLFRFLGAEVRTVVLVPSAADTVLKSPLAIVPFSP